MALAKYAEEIQETIWDNEERLKEKGGCVKPFHFPCDETDSKKNKGEDKK